MEHAPCTTGRCSTLWMTAPLECLTSSSTITLGMFTHSCAPFRYFFAHSLPPTTHPFKSSLAPLWILSLPGLTTFLLRSPSWHFSSMMHRTLLGLHLVGSKPRHYNGPSIPGNFDTHSGEIVDSSTFLLKVHKLSQPLTDEYIKGLVSKDNLRGPKRFLLGLYSPRKNDKLHSTCHSPHPYPRSGS